MTLQTDLQEAVVRVQFDSQILHQIVHGNDQTVVPTEGGNVKTVAKAIKDIEDKGVFYGLRKDGAKLLAESGNGTFVAKDYLVWFITLPGVDFSIGPNGHLHINI